MKRVLLVLGFSLAALFPQIVSGASGTWEWRAPPTLALLPNTPNPFNPITTLHYVVPSEGHVTLRVDDVAGRLVTTLVDGRRSAGMNMVEWDGTDAAGNPVASGVYVSRLRVGTATLSRTMVLLK